MKEDSEEDKLLQSLYIGFMFLNDHCMLGYIADEVNDNKVEEF